MAATNDFESYAIAPESHRHALAITPHDTNELANVTRRIFVGGAGNIVLVTVSGETVTFTGVTAGSTLPVAAKIVKSTLTTATNLVAMW